MPTTGSPWPAAVQRVRADPFGAARSGQAGTVEGRGFLGAPVDDTGLTLLGARFYDPGTGTFLSVDPLLDPALPAQYNAYVYAANNPTTWADPSGESWAHDPDRPQGQTINVPTEKVSVSAGESDQSRTDRPTDTDSAATKYAQTRYEITLALEAAILSGFGFFGLKPLATKSPKTKSGKSAATAVANATTIRNDLLLMEPGQTRGHIVGSVDELEIFFTRWTQGVQRTRVVKTADGHQIDQYSLPDGTMVQWRSGSRSGGPTIEYTFVGMKQEKVHIVEF